MLEVVAMAAAVAAMTCPDRIFSPVHQLTIQWVGLALTRPWHRQTMKWAQCLGNMDSRRDTTRRPTIGDVCLLYLRLQQDPPHPHQRGVQLWKRGLTRSLRSAIFHKDFSLHIVETWIQSCHFAVLACTFVNSFLNLLFFFLGFRGCDRGHL